jgi:hypothetical protein
VKFIKVTDITHIQNLKTKWEELIESHWNEEHLDDLYRSFDWVEHLVCKKKNQNIFVTVVKTARNKLIGLIPFTGTDYTLKFDLKSHKLFTVSLPVVWILGSDLILPHKDNFYDQFFSKISNEFPHLQGIYFESVKENSYLFNYLKESGIIEDNFFLYLPEHYRNYYYVALPDSFETYRDSLKSKRRNNLTKKIKAIKGNFGKIELRSFETEHSVPSFIEEAIMVSKKSWQYQIIGQRIDNSIVSIENKMDLARRNIFYSFVLYGGDVPLAFSLGYRHNATYLGEEIAYDKDFADFSPGIVLMYLIIENLINNGIRRLNMGVGEGFHKYSLANRQIKDAAVLLLRKNPSNIVYLNLHKYFMTTKRVFKKVYDSIKK